MGISESLAVRIEGDAQMLPSEKTNTESPRVAVVGVGGAGCNIVSAFAGSGCPVDTIAINTDKDALHRSTADTKIYICKAVLKGEVEIDDQFAGGRAFLLDPGKVSVRMLVDVMIDLYQAFSVLYALVGNAVQGAGIDHDDQRIPVILVRGMRAFLP